MNGEERRNIILSELEKAKTPVNATKLAELCSVTRQIIVADVALLRASGVPIRAEHRGYRLEREEAGIEKRIVCCHKKEDVRNEFYAIVDHGGKVRDVMVEHSIYGQISATLRISSRKDADDFVRKTALSGASHLSDLTAGIHIHTLTVPSEESFEAICKTLSDLGILIDHD